jgi:integrase
MGERIRLTKRTVEAAPRREAEYFLWDSDLAGYGLRVWPSGRRTYVVQYRVHGGRGGRQRRLTLGTFPALLPDRARDRAAEVLAGARLGSDAADERDKARTAATVAQLIDLWLREAAHINRRTGALRTEANVAGEEGRIEAHIKPLLGMKRLTELCRGDIERFRDQIARGVTKGDRKTRLRGRARVRGGAGTATRTVRLLSSILAFGVDRGLLSDNPCRGVRLSPGRSMNRFLSAAELRQLGIALEAARADGAAPPGVDIIRLLALTGARKNEIAGLCWSEVDLAGECLRLVASKTGAKVIPLAPAALAILSGLDRHAATQWVFPASRGAGHFVNTGKVWEDVRARAGLVGVRLHDLRHTYASFGASGGFGLPVIGALLGHRQPATTARYAHLADDPLKRAANRIGGQIDDALRLAAAG